MNTSELGPYVAGRIRSGIGKEEVREELLSVGWSEEEADAAYRAGVIELGAPIPTEENRPTLSQKSSAADITVNFFSFVMLGVVATALGTLFFQIINLKFPDALASIGIYRGDRAAMSAIHYAIAALLIGFPLYFGAMKIWFRKFRDDEGRVESRLSKWLTYIVLLAAAGTIVGDLITTVFTFLQGEITARFALKALVILSIAGTIFGFYFLERKKIQYKKPIARTVFQRFGIGVSAAVVIGIVLGFLVGGSPEMARQQAFDDQRVNDLSSLASCVENYARDLGSLPESMVTLRRSSAYTYCGTSSDPETGEPYEYRIVTPSRAQGTTRVGEFELCATSVLPSASPVGRESFGGYAENPMWSEHEAGRSCDVVTVQLGIPTQTIIPDQSSQFSPEK